MQSMAAIAIVCAMAAGAEPLQIATFNVDASPPIGSPLAYDQTIEVTDPLSCRGIVLLGNEAPIVLCAVDWIGIANDGHREFREKLASAAGTTPDRVAVHALHQHDAPRCDFSADAIAAEVGVNTQFLDAAFARDVIHRTAAAIRSALANPQPVTHVGFSSATVEKVASNRRILGPDGKVQYVRYTATSDPKIRAFPEGTIDPKLRMIVFWNEDQPLAALTYYATHPQSYYRTGKATPDFPGLARNARQEATGVLHVHFNGAGGNIGAGKYNDGAHENRQILADRVADAMERAWNSVSRVPVRAADVRWESRPVSLPVSEYLNADELEQLLADSNQPANARFRAACQLAWVRRCAAGDTIDIGCLTIGNARILHMPGELFVEYQLAAQQLRPDLFVCMAAYGEYGPSYIGTEIAYSEVGYETSPGVSLVAPSVERVLVDAMKSLLDAENVALKPLGVEAHEREVKAARERAGVE